MPENEITSDKPYTEEEMKEAMARKITKEDIEELKDQGIDHWMFDEMFEED